jgi:acyl transferase domain-containing protein
VSLFRLIESWGVRPDYLLGHSIGELAAAFVAGVFSLEDACKLVAARGRLMGALPGGGAMFAVEASEREALESLEGSGDRVALAAVNGPMAIVLSGEHEAASELAGLWRTRGRKVKQLQVSHAFHSCEMEAMLADFAEIAGGVAFTPPRIAVVSNLTGQRCTEQLCSPEYWVRQVRETVRFADGVGWLAAQGVGSFLELGPEGVLSAMTDECLRAADTAEDELPRVAATLRAGSPEAHSLIAALAHLWSGGAPLDWRLLLGDRGTPTTVGLPTYQFQRERFWLDALPAGPSAGARAIAADLRYRVSWKPIHASAAAGLPGTWLVFAPSAHIEEDWVASVLASLGSGARLVSVDLDRAETDRRWLAERLCQEQEACPDAGVGGVVSLLALHERGHALAGSVPAGLAGALALTQALEDVGLDAPLWLLTRAAMAVAPSERVGSPIQAQTWGLGLTIGLERPRGWGGLVDLPETFDERVGALLVAMLAGGSTEDQLAIRGSGTLARRLVEAPASQTLLGETWTPPSGTILLTGATGGLGGHIARRLAQAGAQHLLLVSRGGAGAPGAEQLRAELIQLGAHVSIAACDVSERDQLERLIEALPAEHPLEAVVHAAGAGTQVAMEALTLEDLERALSAKVQGALHLDALTQGLDLSAFVLFSSIAGTLGSGMQAPYAAANACLDALAEGRQARGLPATSIAWGPWQGEGMAGEQEVGEALRRRGLEQMTPDAALDALGVAMLGKDSTVAVADIRWESYAPLFTFARPRPLIEDLPAVRAALGETEHRDDGAAGELRERLLGAAPEDRRKIALQLVRTEVARVLGHASSQSVEPKRAFKDLGFDSLTAVELRNRLEASTGLGLVATLAFDYPTPVALADHLLAELAGDGDAASTSFEAGLAKLERAPTAFEDSAQRRAVAARLRALLARLENGERETSANEEAEEPALLERMQVASDEEIFDFIDSQLGTS